VSVTGTVYLLHFDRPYKHARHYIGKPESSRFLNGRGVCLGGEFAVSIPSRSPRAVRPTRCWAPG
jgi:hypothetical protein